MNSPRTTGLWMTARLAMAALTLAAILAQLVVTMSGAAEAGRDVATTAVNFFSFFTILSNVAAAVVLVEQNVDTALALATRAHVLERGTIVESGEVRDLHDRGVLEQRLAI